MTDSPEDSRLNDLLRFAAGACSLVLAASEDGKAALRHSGDRVLDALGLVRREEFEAVRAMAAKARARQDELAERLAGLEKRRGGA